MSIVDISEAKTCLLQLVASVEAGREKEIVIARNGRPVARLVAICNEMVVQRVGVARGEFKCPQSIDHPNKDVANLFLGPDS